LLRSRLQAQLGLARLAAEVGNLGLELGAKCGDVRFGGEFGALSSFLNRGDHGLGLWLGEAGLSQSFCTLSVSIAIARGREPASSKKWSGPG